MQQIHVDGKEGAKPQGLAQALSKGIDDFKAKADLEEVLGLSHRVMVMSRGEMRGILHRSEVNSAKVMALAVL